MNIDKKIWKIHNWVDNLDIALSNKSLMGPDLWIEEKFPDTIFMSDDLVRKIKGTKPKVDFSFVSCRVMNK